MIQPFATLRRRAAASMQSPPQEAGPPPPEGPPRLEGAAPRAAGKFLYPSGARPLAGYTLKRGVGRGGFGEVYFATSDAGKEVALKLIRRNLDVELRGVTHCLNLKHPNLIALYDIRTDDQDDQWVVMEYVQGESLEELLARSPQGLPPAEVDRWMRGIAAGVAHLHANGIVHRDLKPGNVFLDRSSGPQGEVKIGDYGLSKFISCSRRSGQTESVGTVHYMAPEIAGGRYGREIDTYAMGVMLYEMLTGRVPFEGESVGEVLMKHLTAEPDLTGLAEPYAGIVRRALTKDPALRIQSTAEMVSLLPESTTAAPVYEQVYGAEQVYRANSSADGSPSGAAAAAAQAERVLRPPSSPAEPIWKAVGTGFNDAYGHWVHSQSPWFVKGFVALLVLLLLSVTVRIMLPIVLTLTVLYVLYFIIWAWLIRPNLPPPDRADGKTALYTYANQVSPQRGAAPPARGEKSHGPRYDWRERARVKLLEKTWRVHLAETLTAMLASGGACAAIAVGPALVFGQTAAERQGVYLWFAVVCTLASWVVLLVNRTTEGRAEDQTPMRTMLFGAGAGLGFVAHALNELLLVGVPIRFEPGLQLQDSIVYGALGVTQQGDIPVGDGFAHPDLLMFVGYFGLLFLLLRWWRLAEWTRERRMRVGQVIWCGIAAWLVGIIWWFPQPTGLLFAATVAAAVQLASPWLPPSKRVEMAKEALR